MAPNVTLYTAGTPNGHKVSLILEELKAAYPNAELEYEVKALSFAKNEQKEPWYLKINPNGRIPAIVHHRPDGKDFAVFESAAIILYLVQRFDPDYKLSFPAKSDDESEALQWIFFAHGGIGPMQGQAGHFVFGAPEKIPYAITRYQNETKRLYTVLESRLQERDWLAGPGRGTYSIADINAWSWVKSWARVGIENIDDCPNLAKWIDRIAERPTTKKAITVPS